MNTLATLPRILRGLQHVYITPELRQEVFVILQQAIPENVNSNNGCPGMDLWRVLVLGTLQLSKDEATQGPL
jgi:hypothetical protein